LIKIKGEKMWRRLSKEIFKGQDANSMKRVLAAFDNGNIDVIYVEPINPVLLREVYGITHWMPLPKHPLLQT
jgi:hypothetical protein